MWVTKINSGFFFLISAIITKCASKILKKFFPRPKEFDRVFQIKLNIRFEKEYLTSPNDVR